MNASVACPSDADYRRLSSGNIAREEMEPLLRHLEQCGRCTAAFRALEVQDELLEAARNGPPAPLRDGEGSVPNGLLERLDRLPCRPAADETAVGELQAAVSADLAEPPAQLGPYRLLRRLGAGGMGEVHEAEHVTHGRRVALKVLRVRPGVSREQRQRFEREARAAVAVKHDNIVTVYEVGEAAGVFYLAMELLHETLAQRLEQQGRLPLAEAVAIGAQIAEGLAAAHRAGFWHRDVKPSNIGLERTGGGQGEAPGTVRVKLLDFGLARPVASPSALTATDAILGTPGYLAPEQASGDRIDDRADLFSLGCVLYELTTGESAFPGRDFMVRLNALATTTPRPPRQLRRDVPQALSDLIVRLLQKDPARRPSSAREVAQALRGIAEGLPAKEEFPTRPRRRLYVAAGAVVLAVATAGFSLWTKSGETGIPATVNSHDRSAQHTSPLDGLDPAKIPAVYREGLPQDVVAVLPGLLDGVTCLAFAPDCRRLLAAYNAPETRNLLALWDVVSSKELHRFDGVSRFDTHSVAFSPDGLRVLSGGWRYGMAPSVELRDAETGSTVRRFGTADVNAVAFSPDGRRALTGDRAGHALPGSVCLWDVETGALLHQFRGHGGYVFQVTFSPDGKTALSSGGNDRTVRQWDLEARKLLGVWEHPSDVGVLAFFPNDGRKAVAACADGRVYVSDLAGQQAREPKAVFRGHTTPVAHLAFSPDGRKLAATADGGRVIVWEPTTGETLQEWQVPTRGAPILAFAPDGRHLAVSAWSAGKDRVWIVRLAAR